jgi:zinc/manganese transport system substrate-binding protein
MRPYLIWIAALSLALAACGGSSPSAGGALRVVATTTQVGEAARAVGGDDIELTVLLSPGAEAHEFEITPPAAAALERSDLILKSGAGLESWLDDELTTIGADDRVKDMSVGIDLRAPAAGAEAGEEVDPHYWLTAPNSIHLVENVRDALSLADPDAASRFAEREQAYVTRLKVADEEIRHLMAEIPPARRGIVTNHDALAYFLAEYGLRFVGSIFPSLDVSAEPNPGDLAKLAETIRAQGVVAIFSESAVNPRLARAIADETGATVVDDPLYTDSLGPPGSGGDTLDGMLLHNATVIHDALVGE